MFKKLLVFCLLVAICQFCNLDPNKRLIVIDDAKLLNKTLNG
jgi:hypothetical protein